MEKKVTFTWVIKNFSSLESERIYSEKFDVGGYKWRISIYPKGCEAKNQFATYLEAVDNESLPSGWRIHARSLLTVVNQEKLSQQKSGVLQEWFDENDDCWGYPYIIHSGFLVNGELKIVAEVELLEVVGTTNVNGFQVLLSQVEDVNRMFEKHPEIASEFRPKNQNIRTAYMSFLLSLIETMRRSPDELSKDDLDDVRDALKSFTCVGFKLDWLEKKLDQVSKNKEIVIAGEVRIQDLKRKYSDLESQLEKEKEKVSTAKSSLSFDDVI